MVLRAFSLCLIIVVFSSNVVSQNFAFEEKRKSPVAAFTISAASTAIPFFVGTTALKGSPDWIGTSLITAALIAGPSMGYLYSQNTNRFKRGMFVRGGAVGMVALGGLGLMTPDDYDDVEDDDWDALMLVVTGTAVFSYSILSDWFGAAQSAKRYNERSWNIQPAYDFETRTPLLSLRVNF